MLLFTGVVLLIQIRAEVPAVKRGKANRLFLCMNPEARASLQALQPYNVWIGLPSSVQ